MTHGSIRLLLTLLLAALLCRTVSAENWPGWRGPRGDGTSLEKELPVQWDAKTGQNIAWKVKLPYSGHASPVVWDDSVLIVGADVEAQRRMLVRLDRRTGETVWEQDVLKSPLETKHRLNSFASSTPATDGRSIYVAFLEVDGSTIPARNVSRVRPVTPGTIVVKAFDLDGNEVWTARPGEFVSVHGFSSCPVIYEDKLIINGDHDGDSYIVALDRTTGRTLWKIPREHKTRSYCTPILREIDGRPQLIMSGSKCVSSYNPDDGSLHWIIDGPTEQFVASCVYSHGLVYVTAGFPEKHLMAIDPTGRGDVTESHIEWWHQRKDAAYVPSPVIAGNYLYVAAESGIGYCYDARTGERMWRERMGRRYSASLVSSAGGHVYFLDDDGNTKVVNAGPTFQLVAENRLGEFTSASPAASQGQLFLRGEKHLFCIGKGER